MSVFSLFQSYLLWHYVYAVRDGYALLRNAFWFIGRIFSVPLLIRTLFSPWHRLHEEVPRFFENPGEFFTNIIVNIIMRCVGFSVRFAYLLLAFMLCIVIVAFWICALPLWYALPLLSTLFFLVPLFL